MDGKHVAINAISQNEKDLNKPQQNKKSNGLVLNAAELENNPICRICYGGPSSERLIRPCNCRGSIQHVHRHCLERWLQSTHQENQEACELCHAPFATKRTRGSIWNWCRRAETRTDRRNLFGDIACCTFLTPLGVASFWLCAEGALFYQNVKHSTLEAVALIALAAFLVLAYVTWFLLCSRYHYMIWSRWSHRNYNVQILDRDSTPSRQNSEEHTGTNNLLLQPLIPLEQPMVNIVPQNCDRPHENYIVRWTSGSDQQQNRDIVRWTSGSDRDGPHENHNVMWPFSSDEREVLDGMPLTLARSHRMSQRRDSVVTAARQKSLTREIATQV